MLATALFYLALVGLSILSVALWAVFLRLGLHWAKVPDVTFRRIVKATGIVTVLEILLVVVFQFVEPPSFAAALALFAVQMAVAVTMPCLVIMRVFRIGFFRSVLAWLPTWVPHIAMAMFVFVVVTPLVWQGFSVPTNAMAPTILGNHVRSACPECGQPNFCSLPYSDYSAAEPQWMICENFHCVELATTGQQQYAGDRILVAKYLKPQRWDVIVFRFPGDPSTNYVKRLVGLPGETIHIAEGAVWVDGTKLEPPESLRGIEYHDEPPYGSGEIWGAKNNPAVLADDEYFVLGDFSPQSLDSRYWEQGAPQHNPYAVPASYMVGVVSHIYWPPQRWRAFR